MKIYVNQTFSIGGKEYGYVRGEPISVLNKKIREKIEHEKEMYFKQFESKSTVTTTRLADNSQKF
jgi:hypothetical protein